MRIWYQNINEKLTSRYLWEVDIKISMRSWYQVILVRGYQDTNEEGQPKAGDEEYISQYQWGGIKISTKRYQWSGIKKSMKSYQDINDKKSGYQWRYQDFNDNMWRCQWDYIRILTGRYPDIEVLRICCDINEKSSSCQRCLGSIL